MANLKISGATAATTLADTDVVPLASGGASKKITGANLKTSLVTAEAVEALGPFDGGAVPSMGPTVLAPWDVIGGPVNTQSAPGANWAHGQRCYAYKTGTLTKIAVYVVTSSGNIDVGLYSISGDNRTRLASAGSTALSGTNAWQVFTVSAAVTKGTAYDLVFAIDNGTATVARFDHGGSNTNPMVAPPTGFPGAGSWVRWAASSSFALPSSFTAITGKNQHQYSYAIMGLIT